MTRLSLSLSPALLLSFYLIFSSFPFFFSFCLTLYLTLSLLFPFSLSPSLTLSLRTCLCFSISLSFLSPSLFLSYFFLFSLLFLSLTLSHNLLAFSILSLPPSLTLSLRTFLFFYQALSFIPLPPPSLCIIFFLFSLFFLSLSDSLSHYLLAFPIFSLPHPYSLTPYVSLFSYQSLSFIPPPTLSLSPSLAPSLNFSLPSRFLSA